MNATRHILATAGCAAALAFAHAAAAQVGTPHPATPINSTAQAQPAAKPAARPAPAQAARPAPANMAAQVDATFARWDTNHDNALSQQEFRNGWAGLRNAMMANRLREQFNAVDANKNGAIDPSEYGSLYLVKHAGASAPAFASFDANHDQKLDFNEYAALVQRLAAQERGNVRPAPASK